MADGQLCDIVQDDSNGDWIGRRFGIDGPLVFEVRPDAARLTTTGPCIWGPASPAPSSPASNGDGVLRVGVDIEPGRYVAPNSRTVECYWETASDEDGSLAAITDNSFSTGPQIAVIETGDRLFSTSGCGTWTPLPVLPDAYMSMITSPASTSMMGHRAFYSGDELYLGASSNVFDIISVNGQGWSLNLMGPRAARLENGTWPTDVGPTDTTPQIIVSAPSRVVCVGEPGEFTVANLVRDESEKMIGFDIYWLSECDGAFPNLIHIHQSPPAA